MQVVHMSAWSMLLPLSSCVRGPLRFVCSGKFFATRLKLHSLPLKRVFDHLYSLHQIKLNASVHTMHFVTYISRNKFRQIAVLDDRLTKPTAAVRKHADPERQTFDDEIAQGRKNESWLPFSA